jgi:hypothetical protein
VAGILYIYIPNPIFMKRSLAALALLLFIVPAFAQDTKAPTVTIKREVKKHTTPGEYEVILTFTCENGPVSGYARYKENLTFSNKDASVSCTNNGSSSFSYEGGQVKFLWTSLALHESMVISYLVKNGGDEVKSSVKGNFGYVYDNTKQMVALDGAAR